MSIICSPFKSLVLHVHGLVFNTEATVREESNAKKKSCGTKKCWNKECEFGSFDLLFYIY